jgi:SAM-dependent methyltransferase
MKNTDEWRPTKFVQRRNHLRGARDDKVVGVGSRLICDLVAHGYEDLLPKFAFGRLLDLGCGEVPLYGLYRAFVTEVTCADWTPNPHIDHQCDLTQPLPFPGESFDTILLSDVLEHIPNPEEFFREMTRVLSPGGRVIINVPFTYWIHAHPYDFHRYTNFALQRLVEINGLDLILLRPFGGLVEVMADMGGKTALHLPLLGKAVAVGLQTGAFGFSKTPTGRRLLERTAQHAPLGYFVVAQKAPICNE